MTMTDLIPALVALCDESDQDVDAYTLVSDLEMCAYGDDDGGWLPEYRNLLVDAEAMIEKHTDVEPGSEAMLATLADLLDAMDDLAVNAND